MQTVTLPTDLVFRDEFLVQLPILSYSYSYSYLLPSYLLLYLYLLCFIYFSLATKHIFRDNFALS